MERESSGIGQEMPRYKCHKEVWALKIASIRLTEDGRGWITPAEDGYAPFEVSAAYVSKHEPTPGGYYVVYKDGYQSFSPAKAFEDGYTPAGWLEQIKQGWRERREEFPWWTNLAVVIAVLLGVEAAAVIVVLIRIWAR